MSVRRAACWIPCLLVFVASCGTTPIPSEIAPDGGPTGPRDGGASCDGLLVGGLRYVDTGTGFERGPVFAATPTRLYFARSVPLDGSPFTRTDLVSLDPFGGATLSTEPLGDREVFLDANATAQLRARGPDVGSNLWSLVLRVGEVERVLGRTRMPQFFDGYQSRTRLLSATSTRVVWRGEDGVYVFDGQVSARVAGLPRTPTNGPSIDDAVAAVDGPGADGGANVVYAIRGGSMSRHG